MRFLKNIPRNIPRNKFTNKQVDCQLKDIQVALSIDYEPTTNTNYIRYCPNYFRAVPPEAPGFPNYEDAFNQDNEYGQCLRKQLSNADIIIWPLEVLFILLVPSTMDSSEAVLGKDNIRNEFIAFCLNIEKSFLYYQDQKLTCNNQIVPWDGYFDINKFQGDNTRLNFVQDFPLVQIDQVVVYNISVNYFANTIKNFFNFRLILEVLNGTIPVDDPSLTSVNFYQVIFFTYELLTFLFSISNKLLNGLTTGLPQEIINKFFPLNRQLYYYNLYLTWIQSRNAYLGFGDKINSSNGDSTNIQIPNKLILQNIKIPN